MCVRDKRIMTIAKCMKKRKVKEDKEKILEKHFLHIVLLRKNKVMFENYCGFNVGKNSKHVNIQGILLIYVRSTQGMNRKAFINVR